MGFGESPTEWTLTVGSMEEVGKGKARAANLWINEFFLSYLPTCHNLFTDPIVLGNNRGEIENNAPRHCARGALKTTHSRIAHFPRLDGQDQGPKRRRRFMI